LSLPFEKILVVLAQLRHMPLAEWSKKAAVENEQYVRIAAKISQANWLALEIDQGEVRGRGVESNFRHRNFPYNDPRLHSN
jgi:hypothetical protein